MKYKKYKTPKQNKLEKIEVELTRDLKKDDELVYTAQGRFRKSDKGTINISIKKGKLERLVKVNRL